MSASSPAPGRRRRWPFAVGGAVLVLGCVVVGWWFLWLPNWRPHLHDGEHFGVDVSAHQGEINWAKVADDDIGFTYIKATEGGDFEDPRFASNWRGAAEAGADVYLPTMATEDQKAVRIALLGAQHRIGPKGARFATLLVKMGRLILELRE